LALATFYFKKLFIIFGLGLINAGVLMAQTAAIAPSTTIQRDKAGRPVYTDSDGDRIVILDFKTRNDLKNIEAFKNFDPTKAPMDPKSFYKESVVNIKIEEAPKVVYKNYTVEEGDTWESVSKKLYGTEDKVTQLKLWNEDLLADVNLKTGAQMKYVESKN
jgi:nucleoid-associated protein YgaU